MKQIHRLLERQIRRHIGHKELIPAELASFIEAVNEAYTQSDIDRAMVERSLELSSQELLHSNAEMRAVFQALPDQYFRIDQEGNILDYKSPRLKEGDIPQLIRSGMNLSGVLPAATWDILRENVESVIRSQAIITLESPLKINGGGFLYEARLVPIFNKQVIIILRDITARKQAEQESERLQNQLLHAQKMEAIGTLAGGVAHDFNNLLMGIQGYASLALHELDAGNFCRGRLQGIEEQVKRGADLTRQLLGFARGGKYEVKTARLNELIADTADMFGRTKKEISIVMNLQEHLWSVDIDRGQIEQVLLNLFINAWQAMPGGGKLSLETVNHHLNEHAAEPHDIKAGRYIRVSIADTGVGMDHATLQRIFEPFFTTKAIGQGTGLGLASAYGIIKNHGGFIDAASTPGAGTTFMIYLPASQGEVSEEKRYEGKLLSGHETILIVDDEHMNLLILKDLLSVIGYRILMAGSGQEAVAVYLSKKNQIDLVVMDMIMPGMGGGKAFENLREINPDVKVILCSGYSIDGEAETIMEKGCNGFIQKPFTIEALSQKIREVLKQTTGDQGTAGYE